jgi:dihydroflavonol-4-reductase
MRVALTGVTGHLGAATVRTLLDRGYEVSALVRGNDQRSIDGLPVKVLKGDILDPGSLEPFLAGCEALIHCAAEISIDGDPKGIVRQTNVEGTRNILKAAHQHGVRRLVHVSSIHVFRQDPRHAVLDETAPLIEGPAFAYERSKRVGQEIALSYHGKDIEVLVMIPTSIIGPWDYKPSLAGRAMVDILRGRRPFLVRGGYDFCDVRDVANGLVSALTQGDGGSTYILGGKWYSLREIAEILGQLSGRRISTLALPVEIAKMGLPFVRAASRLSGKPPLFTKEALHAVTFGNRQISSARAKAVFNYRSRPVRETLQDIIVWFEQLGYL